MENDEAVFGVRVRGRVLDELGDGEKLLGVVETRDTLVTRGRGRRRRLRAGGRRRGGIGGCGRRHGSEKRMGVKERLDQPSLRQHAARKAGGCKAAEGSDRRNEKMKREGSAPTRRLARGGRAEARGAGEEPRDRVKGRRSESGSERVKVGGER